MQPIIAPDYAGVLSKIDTDYYKLTMSQLFFEKWPNEYATFEFINRSDVPIADIIEEKWDGCVSLLRDEFRYFVEGVQLTPQERKFLEAQGIFSKDYLDWLEAGADLDKVDIVIENRSGDLYMKFIGPWASASLFEVPALSIVSEYYNSADFNDERADRLPDKFDKLVDGVKFVDFGTRRRYDPRWQGEIIEECMQNVPNNFVGTSNVYYAMKYGIPVVGTMAHECFMGYARLFGDSEEDIRRSHSEFLNDWWDMYGESLSIALTDTFGTKFFFEDFAPVAEKWRGIRQDSGDPFEFGEKAIEFYENLGIDPKEKMVVFSGGLNFEKMTNLYKAFGDRIGVSFGIGTNLTNDVVDNPVSIVVKLTKINGKNTVKLSDNIAKATGETETIERFKDIFDYDVDYYQKTIY
jgi:nicotinate phosphoribosyltransferase